MSGYIHNCKSIFIHVPKTAGTSIERLPWINTRGHNPVWTFPQRYLEDYFTFGFVREPHSRFMSAATAGFLVEGNPPFGPKPNPPSFPHMRNEITRSIKNIWDTQKGKELRPDYIFERNRRRYPAPLPHFMGWPYRIHFYPMWFFLTNRSGNIAVDMVGRFENLDSSWRKICDRMGVVYEPLPHLRNGQIHRPPLDYFYTPETWDMVSILYQKDFELFDYPILDYQGD